MKFAVIGSKGKLGSTIVNTLKESKHDTIEIDKHNSKKMDISGANAVIDVSTHKNTINIAKICRKTNIPLLIACTGHTKIELEKIKQTMKNTPYEISSNLSQGMNFVFDSLKTLQSNTLLGATIFEQHHKNKKDSPSGTAKELKKILDNNFDIQTEVVSSRFLNAVGTHKITLEFQDETITITHISHSRKAFSDGAVKILEKLAFCQKNPNAISGITGAQNEQN